MTSYSYKPMRISGDTLNHNKLSHLKVSYHNLKLFTQDQKIRDKYLDRLEKDSHRGMDIAKGTVAPKVPNPGMKEDVSPEVSVDSENLIPLDDDARMTNRKMADFHHARSNLFFETVRIHHNLAYKRRTEAAVTTDVDALPTTDIMKLPSLWATYPEAADHKPEVALDYHRTLQGDSMVNASHYRKWAEMIKKDLDDLGPNIIDDDETKKKRIKLQEAMSVCEELCNMYTHLSEIHSQYADDFTDYLMRRADATFDRDNDNQLTNPSVHRPNPNPAALPGTDLVEPI